MFGNAFGIDLGTSEIRIYSQKKDAFLTEKNMAAIRNRSQLLAVGNDAFAMYEKTPPSVEVFSPIEGGSISDIDMTEVVLHRMLEKLDRHIGVGPDLYFAKPYRCSDLERRAYRMISHAGSLRNPHVHLVDRPVCDALSFGIPLNKTAGCVVVGFGAQNTEMSVIAGGQVLLSKSVPHGGWHMDETICSLVRRRHNLIIGRRTARRLKAVLGTFRPERGEARKVTGMNTLSGLPREAVVSAQLVFEAINETAEAVAKELREFIDRIPPQVRIEALREGIYLAGGVAKIPEIEGFFEKASGTAVNMTSHFGMSTICGLKEIVRDRTLSKWTETL